MPTARIAAFLLPGLAWMSALADPAELAGTWVGRAEVAGEPGSFVLHLEPGADGGLAARVGLPQMGLESLQAGEAKLADGVLEVAGTRLRWDPQRGTLTGPLPAALVPVHEVTVVLERGVAPPPARPSATGPRAEPAWTTDLGAPVYAGVAAGNGRIYAATDAGSVLALDADGEILWRFDTGGAVRARPALAGGAVYVHSDDGALYRLDAADGSLRWRAALGGPAPRTRPGSEGYRYDRYASAAVVAGERVYVGTLHGEVVALTAGDGAELWRYRADDAVESTPALSGGRLYFGSYDGHVYALDADTGGLIWRFDTGAPVVSTPAVADGVVVVGSRSYDLYGLSADAGEVLWRRYYWYSWVESSATIRDGIAYIGSSDGRHVSAWRVRNGTRVWRYRTGGPAWARPAVSGERVIAATVGVPGYSVEHRPALHALDRATGAPVWHYPAPAPKQGYSGFVSAPEVDGGRVYVGGLDGRLYAFPLSAGR